MSPEPARLWACLGAPSTGATVDNDGIKTLINKNRRKPNLKNRIEESIKAAVVGYATEYQPMVRFGPATNCANKACSFSQAECVQSGCTIN